MANDRIGFTVYVDSWLLERLKKQAASEDRTLSGYVSRLLNGKGDVGFLNRIYMERSRAQK
jgi:hypothetical protein